MGQMIGIQMIMTWEQIKPNSRKRKDGAAIIRGESKGVKKGWSIEWCHRPMGWCIQYGLKLSICIYHRQHLQTNCGAAWSPGREAYGLGGVKGWEWGESGFTLDEGRLLRSLIMLKELNLPIKGDCGGSYGIPLQAGTHLWSGELQFCSLSSLPLCWAALLPQQKGQGSETYMAVNISNFRLCTLRVAKIYWCGCCIARSAELEVVQVRIQNLL